MKATTETSPDQAPLDVRLLLERQPGRHYELHSARVNPANVRTLKTIGFDRCYVAATVLLLFISAAGLGFAATPLDEESPWPRVRSTNGHTVTLHLPQVERWTSNSFTARAAVEVKLAGTKSELFGVAWFEAQGSVDRSQRRVTLDRLEVTRARFPDSSPDSSNALAVLRQLIPAGARTVSLDYLVTALGFAQAAARQGSQGLKHSPPDIVWATNHTVLVIIDGEPVLRPIPASSLERVINTPVLLVRDTATAKLYLEGPLAWYTANSIRGPWSLAQDPPPEIAALASAKTGQPMAADEVIPRVIVSTSPSELIMTGGLPDFRPIRGTALQYAADTDSLLFFHTTERQVYLLLSGRWFKAGSLHGPWTYVAGADLPSDFARIPSGSAQAVVLASVPNTPEAELALLATTVPTTATVNRREARIQLTYDGEPQFKAIEGTSMMYAINAPLPVIRTGEQYYALDNGVWFLAASPTGPWEAAIEVPEEIYTIPPSSPVYYATFAQIYEATEDEIETGYTAGYQGAYEEDGTVVYGTGWDYPPWYGYDYYGWGWTWGYGYVYVPWYQWWVWRPWWNPSGGLRAALIENIYDRWQGRTGVIHHDRSARASARLAASGSSGFPALYGRFKGATRPVALSPPANTLALNPYSRPQSSVRPGDMPRGAQSLAALARAPGGGLDLYASPDGNVYRRKNDGWYRREVGGGWSYFAPTQGRIEPARSASAGGGQLSGAGNVWRPTPGPNAAANRAQAHRSARPDTGVEARAGEIAALEREYYARSLAQMRSQPSRPARPARGTIRRR